MVQCVPRVAGPRRVPPTRYHPPLGIHGVVPLLVLERMRIRAGTHGVLGPDHRFDLLIFRVAPRRAHAIGIQETSGQRAGLVPIRTHNAPVERHPSRMHYLFPPQKLPERLHGGITPHNVLVHVPEADVVVLVSDRVQTPGVQRHLKLGHGSRIHVGKIVQLDHRRINQGLHRTPQKVHVRVVRDHDVELVDANDAGIVMIPHPLQHVFRRIANGHAHRQA